MVLTYRTLTRRADGAYYYDMGLLSSFDTRMFRDRLQIRPRGKKRWVDEDSNRYYALLEREGIYPGDVTVEDWQLSLSEIVLNEDINAFRDIISGLPRYLPQLRTIRTEPDGSVETNIFGFQRLGRTYPTLNSTDEEILEFIRRLKRRISTRTYDENEYYDSMELIFTELSVEDADLSPLFSGDLNCVIKAVLPLCSNKLQKKRLLEYERTIHNTGATTKTIKDISYITKSDISVKDIAGNTWVEFFHLTKNTGKRHIILLAHNNHCYGATNTSQLKQVDTQFVDNINIDDYPNAYRITADKYNNITSVSTDTAIYKLRFDECELYPKCFGDGGVAKKKFLEQYAQFTFSKNSPKLFKHANTPPFYVRISPSNINNVKFDQNQSFRSFDTGCFKGFPCSLDQIFRVPNIKLSRLLELLQLNNLHGLLYIKAKTIDISYFTRKQPIYYERSGFYDMHICLDLLEQFKIDPEVSIIALSKNVFNPDFSTFTKQQFRSFIGKCQSKQATKTFITKDKQEALHLLYRAGDKITSTNINDRIDTDKPITIEVDDGADIWQLVQVSAYVLQHQKYNLFKTINRLFEHDIKIININTDSIEVSKSDAKKIIDNNLLELHNTKIGAWKQERINPNTLNCLNCCISTDNFMDNNSIFTIDQLYSHCKILDITPATTAKQMEHLLLPYSQFLFLTGSAGTGKTQKALVLPDEQGLSEGSVVYLVPENDLISTLQKKAKQLNISNIEVFTYHNYFGIGTREKINPAHTTFIFEEVSKIPADHLELINDKLKKRFNTQKPFADKRIILVGDFSQLPPVSASNRVDCEGIPVKTKPLCDSDLFRLFKTKRLMKNHRQANDPAFYALLEELRNKDKLTKSQIEQLLNKINTRVVPNSTLVEIMKQSELDINSAVIMGTHSGIKRVENYFKYADPNFKPKENMKVINTKTHSTCNARIYNGAHGYIESITTDKHNIDTYHVNFDGIVVYYSGCLPPYVIFGTAMTIHRVQGKTYNNNVVFDPTTLFEKNHLYVAMSRATHLENIYLVQKLSLGQFMRC